MSNEITRENVREFLDRNAVNLKEKETAMDSQERQLRLTINHNHAEKTMTDIQRREARQEEIRALRQKREREREAARIQEMKADAAVRYYGLSCLATILLASVTKFPLWAVLALTGGMGAVLAAYTYRVFYPIQRKKNA